MAFRNQTSLHDDDMRDVRRYIRTLPNQDMKGMGELRMT